MTIDKLVKQLLDIGEEFNEEKLGMFFFYSKRLESFMFLGNKYFDCSFITTKDEIKENGDISLTILTNVNNNNLKERTSTIVINIKDLKEWIIRKSLEYIKIN